MLVDGASDFLNEVVKNFHGHSSVTDGGDEVKKSSKKWTNALGLSMDLLSVLRKLATIFAAV